MKKNSSILFLLCAFLTAAQNVASAQTYTDLYFNTVTSDNNTTYLSTTTNWFTDEAKTSKFEGKIDSTYDGNINATGLFATKVKANTSTTFHDLNYNITNISETNSSFLVLGNDSFLKTTNDFNVNLKFNGVGQSNQLNYKFTLWKNAGINIGGDWNINYNRNNSTDYLSILITDVDNVPNGSEYFKVNGNVVSKGSAFILSTQNTNFTVGGAVDLGGSQWNIARSHTSATSLTRTLGGLGDVDGNGIGNGRINITTSTEMNVDLILKNSKKYDFSTAFGMWENSTSKFNIKMEAADAVNGRQIIRIGSYSTYWCNGSIVYDSNINNVTVSKGRLDLGMHSAMKGNNLSITSSEAVFSATSIGEGECGKVVFDTMDFSSGKIVFDIAEAENDFIQINGAVTRSSDTSKLIFDISVSADSLKEWLAASEIDAWTVDIMSFKTSDSTIVTENILLQTQNGVIGELSFNPNVDTGLTSVSLTLTVPEPATCAAIIGAIALLVVAFYRRRK